MKNNMILLTISMYYIILCTLVFKFVILYDTSIEDRDGRHYDTFAFENSSRIYDLGKATVLFEKYVIFYRRHYAHKKDFDDAFHVFKENLVKINDLNKIYKEAEFRINEFTDLSLWNLTMNYTGFKEIETDRKPNVQYPQWDPGWEREEYDYRKENRVHLAVPHQRNCSNSYIYAAIGALEGQPSYTDPYHRLEINENYALSPQHVFECNDQFTCKTNATPTDVFNAIIAKGGIHSKVSYRSTNSPTYMFYPDEKPKCNENGTDYVVKISECIDWSFQEERHAAPLLALYGPIATSIFVSESIKNYHSGLLDAKDCDFKSNHNVLIVGSGIGNAFNHLFLSNTLNRKTHVSQESLLIGPRGSNMQKGGLTSNRTITASILYKLHINSWGSWWGENGYIRLVRGNGYPCRVAKEFVGKCNINYTQFHVVTTTSAPTTPRRDENTKAHSKEMLRGKITQPIYYASNDESEISSSGSYEEPNIQL